MKHIQEHYDKRVAELAEHGLTPTDVDTELAMVGELLAMVDSLESKLEAAEESGDIARRGLNKVTEMYEELKAKLEAAEWERGCTATIARKLREKLEKIGKLRRYDCDEHDSYPHDNGDWISYNELQAILEDE